LTKPGRLIDVLGEQAEHAVRAAKVRPSRARIAKYQKSLRLMGQNVARKVDARQPGVCGRQIVIGQRARHGKNHIGDRGTNQLEESSRIADGDENIPEATAL